MNNRPKDPKTARNKNVLVIGGSGSGKTRFFVKPNLMQCVSKDYPTSFVITDPKGSLIGEVGQLLIRSSYRVKVLNTINFSKSMKYNPFRYLHSEKDVLKLVNTLICNTKGEGEKSAEDFWVKSERLFYTALIGYIWQEAPEEEMNFTTLLEMINASEAREDDPEFQSPVDLMFERLEERDPDHFAVRQYKKFLLSAGKTRSSILISAGARMAPFDIREVRELMEDDELELDTIGDEKTALFLIMSDTDTTFNFILAMVQSQLINLLCDRADDKYGGRLPVHVRMILDEFANIGQIPNFDKLIATIRSREISASIILQSQSQLKAIYKDAAEIISDNCDCTLFLSGRGKNAKEISDVLGKETIDSYNQSENRGAQTSHGLNYSFGYVAGWSSGKDLKELRASLETIRATAHELITTIDGHLAELQQQRQAQQAVEQIVEPTVEQAAEQPAPDSVFSKLPPEQQQEMTDSVKTMLQTLIDADVKSTGEVTQGTLDAIQTQGFVLSSDRTLQRAEAQEAAYRLESGNILFIQTSENGFDYTVYGPDYKEIDGGQLDNTEYSLSEARDEIFSGIAPQGHVTETITGDALEDFQEAAEQANAISVQPEPQPWNGIDGLLNNKPIMPEATPTERANALIDWAERDGQRMGNEERRLIVEYAETVGDTDKVIELINRLCEQGYEMQHGHMDDFVRSQIESEIAVAKAEQQTALDPAAEPVVTILFTESPHLEMGQQMPLHEADALFARLDAEHRGGGYYDKTDFRIDFTFQGEPHSYSGRQDFGDRDGSLIEHIREYQTFYLNDEKWKDHLTRQGGPEAWAEDHASREAFLTEIIPYMELHCNLSRLEQEAQTRLASSDTLTPEETAYYGALVDYAMECRPLLNHGEPLPEMPKLTDFDQSLQDYKAQVEAEIAQEAADAGMTVEEYAAAGYEAPAQPQEVKEPPQQEAPEQQTKEPAASDYYYSINEGAARRAKEMNSFSDYKPGSATAEYRHYVDKAFALAQEQKKRVDPMYHEKIDSLLDTYARKLAANMNHGYEIDARVPSILIAGGSNFPVRQKEKQNAARDSNMQEWQYIQGLLDKIRSTGMGGIRQDDPQAIPKLQKKLAGLEKAQETMKAVNAYYRKHGTLDGCSHLSPENIENLKADMASGWHYEKKPFQSWELSNNNAEIRRVRQRIESLTRANEVAYVGWEFDGGHVEANRDQGRLQVFFDGKPEADARQQLKEHGFRWAPSVGAWQRLLNDNAYRASDRIACIQPLSGIKPTELQRNSSREQRAQMAQEQAEPDYFYRVHANPRSDSRENLYMLQAYIPQDNGRAKIGDVLYIGTPERCRELMDQLNTGELTQEAVKELYAKEQEQPEQKPTPEQEPAPEPEPEQEPVQEPETAPEPEVTSDTEPQAAPAKTLTELQEKALEIADRYKDLPLQAKIDVIAQAFGCKTGEIHTSPCTGKWRGTSDMTIRFDNGASLFIGNRLTPKAKTVKVQTECVNRTLVQYNPEIVKATKEAALPALLQREAKDNEIAAQKGLKPYTLLNVEFNEGADEKTGGYIGWYYVSLAVDGKICTHLETGLNHDIANGKVSDTPTRADYYPAGALKEADVDYVFNNVGFSSASTLYTVPLRDDVRERAEKTLAERSAAAPEASREWGFYIIPDLKTWATNAEQQTPIEHFAISLLREAGLRTMILFRPPIMLL